jgi:Integrase zinc binding domain
MQDSNCLQCQHQAPHQADEPISFAPKYLVVEGIEVRQCKAAELAANKESSQEPLASQQMLLQDHANPMVLELLGQLPDLCPQLEGDCSILKDIKNGYAMDPILAKVLENSKHHKNFMIADGLIYTCNCAGESILCIPSVILKKQQLTEIIIAQAHEMLGHFGPQKTADYICCHYWWPCIRQNIEQYCKTCLICQTMKSSTQRVPELLHSLPILTHPWGSIAMDFVGLFPESGGYNYLWVLICCLTSMVHLVPICMTTMASKLEWIYI